MLDTLSIWFTMYSKAIATNPLLTGFALYATGLVTYIARNLPLSLWNSLRHATTTSLEMNNAGYTGNEFQFACFMQWYMKSPWSKWSRSIFTGANAVGGSSARNGMIGPGYGRHFFFIGKRLFWFHKTQAPSTGTDKQKEEIRITTFGRSHKPLIDLIEAFAYKPEKTRISIYNFNGKEWCRIGSIEKRSFDTVCIPRAMKRKMIERFDRYVSNPEWFAKKGLAYKVTSLLKGEPGTGKTSIVKAVASYYSRDIYILDLSIVTNASLQLALTSMERKSVLLMEDIDAATNAAESREKKDGASGQASVRQEMSEMMQGLTLAGLLNALDGVVPLNDVMVFTSTNHPERLDPALTRKSRVDYTYEIGKMGDAEIRDYIDLVYPDSAVDPRLTFLPEVGCNVQAAFMESPESLGGFIAQLKYTHALPPSRPPAMRFKEDREHNVLTM